MRSEQTNNNLVAVGGGLPAGPLGVDLLYDDLVGAASKKRGCSLFLIFFYDDKELIQDFLVMRSQDSRFRIFIRHVLLVDVQ